MKNHKKVLPQWCKEAKKALIDRGMDINDLARGLDFSRSYVSNVLNAKYDSPQLQKRICDFLGVASEL